MKATGEPIAFIVEQMVRSIVTDSPHAADGPALLRSPYTDVHGTSSAHHHCTFA